VRLNLLTVALAFTMNTDYISYYFAPLVSWWFLIIYTTMIVGSQYNDRLPFLLAKIVVSMALVTWFMSELWLLEGIFSLLQRFCGIEWSAREWAFRVKLDLWVVYVGMLAAVAYMKIREWRLTDHPLWPIVHKVAVGISSVAMIWFFYFELSQPTKFVYNAWHPYISFVPILAFVCLRNSTTILRSASSKAFAFIGRCSLETFIIQYHFWLAGDTKGILMVIPGTQWRPLNMIITTIMFIYLSHKVAEATGSLTNWICGTSKKSLPTVAVGASRAQPPIAALEPESIPLTNDIAGSVDKDVEDGLPLRPQSSPWLAYLKFANPGSLPFKCGATILVLWMFNMLWPPRA